MLACVNYDLQNGSNSWINVSHFIFENFVLVLKVSYLIKLKLLKFGMAYLNKNKSEQLLYTVFKQTYIQTI